MAVAIWTKAIDDHPDLAGPYLRLASALREAGRHGEAADVLRTGTQRGFHHLLTDLINDYPALVTAEEIEATANSTYHPCTQCCLKSLMLKHGCQQNYAQDYVSCSFSMTKAH